MLHDSRVVTTNPSSPSKKPLSPPPALHSTSGFFHDGGLGAAKLWFYSWTFCLSTVTIVSGCLAERTSLVAYPVFTVLMASWVHPVVVHWAWSRDSWLLGISSECRFLDFAGGTVVHICGAWGLGREERGGEWGRDWGECTAAPACFVFVESGLEVGSGNQRVATGDG